MNDTTITLSDTNFPEGTVDLSPEQVEAIISNVRIIEGNDTDGETNVIHVAPEAEEVPVDVTVH